MSLEVLLMLIFINMLMTLLFIIFVFLLFKQQIGNMNSQDLAFAFYFSFLIGLKGNISLFLAFLSICSLWFFIKNKKQKLSYELQKEQKTDIHIIL